MRVVIIEDEALAARRLSSMIHNYDKTIEIVASLESVAESIEWFSENKHPDLIFLDIHLEDDLSFAIFDKVKINSPIIFTTAFDEYAIKAFKLKSIDYLLKPIVQEELHAALSKYKDMMFDHSPKEFDLQTLYSLISKQSATYRERFSVNVGHKIKTFTISDVAYFLSDGGYTAACLFDGHQYFIDSSLEALAAELKPSDFFRVNRKMITSLSAIKDVLIYPKSRIKLELIPKPENEIFVSIDKSSDFRKWLGANK